MEDVAALSALLAATVAPRTRISEDAYLLCTHHLMLASALICCVV